MEKRVVIAVVLSIAVLYGYSWLVPTPQKKAEEAKPSTQQAAQTQTAAAPAQVPAPAKARTEALLAPARDITVETDLYRAVFSSRGGTLRNFVLKKYRETGGPGAQPVTLINEQSPEFFPLKNEAQGFAVDPAAVCSVNTDSFTVGKVDRKELEFICSSPQGTMLKKTYVIRGDSYAIALNQQLVNTGAARQEGTLRLVLYHRIDPGVKESRFEEHGPVTLSGKNLDALKAKDLEKGAKPYDKEVYWTGYADKYFLSAIIAGTGTLGGVTVRSDRGYVENAVSSARIALNPGETASLPYRLYFGPKDLDNYGIAIIIITVVIKILFYPLTYKSYKSMKDMQKLQPQMAKLKEKYKNDRDAMNKAVMELYREHKVNPMGGCLPMVVQIPVFFALYKALMFSIELRHAPFFLWVTDLADKDPYYVTPVIMGISMFVQQKMTPSQMDPIQQKMMLALPVVFTFMFLSFPSGLVLYWLVNNILTIGQQMYINKLVKD